MMGKPRQLGGFIRVIRYHSIINMPNRKLQAKIKIAQKQLGMEDSIYRDILYRKFRVSTSKALSDSQANVLIHHFKALGWVPKAKPKKYDDQKGDIYSATAAQKRLIEVMWHDLDYTGNPTTSLRRFLFKTVHVSDLRFLTGDQAYRVIESLKDIKNRRHQKCA